MGTFKRLVAATVSAFATLGVAVTAHAAASPTAASMVAAGPLTIGLTCDTGPAGSGTFAITANNRTSTVVVGCGRFGTVTNSAWTAGSIALIHQTVATAAGQLRAANVSVRLTATGETVSIRNFRAAAATTAPLPPRLPQTGSGLAFPAGIALIGLILIAMGTLTAFRQRKI